MSTEFQIFISSTVEDLKDVRKELAAALEQPGRLVRCSEHPSFPVEPGMTSHEACLAMVRRCQAFILLIGTRFGGEYREQNKSITWREWEEACASGLTPIVLVNRKTNDLCRRIAKERAALQEIKPRLDDRAVDRELEKKLRKELKGYHHGPALQRFVDAVRKGHTDNWKLDWSGTAQEAIDYVNLNLAVQASAAERRRQEAREVARRAGETLNHLVTIGEHASLLIATRLAKRIALDKAAQALADLVISYRANLFNIKESDRYAFVVHQARGRKLHPVARAAHTDVPARGRRWGFGEGLVGRAAEQKQFMISGDIRSTAAWVRNPQSDEQDKLNYVSVMAKPFYRKSGLTGGVVTLSSNRVDHFTNPDSPEAVAFDSVVHFFNILMLLE